MYKLLITNYHEKSYHSNVTHMIQPDNLFQLVYLGEPEEGIRREDAAATFD